MSTVAVRSLAELVKATAKFHENSYDKDAAEKAARVPGAVDRADFSEFYDVSIAQAARAACALERTPEFAVPVTLLLTSNWNEALNWAESTLNLFTGD